MTARPSKTLWKRRDQKMLDEATFSDSPQKTMVFKWQRKPQWEWPVQGCRCFSRCDVQGPLGVRGHEWSSLGDTPNFREVEKQPWSLRYQRAWWAQHNTTITDGRTHLSFHISACFLLGKMGDNCDLCVTRKHLAKCWECEQSLKIQHHNY